MMLATLKIQLKFETHCRSTLCIVMAYLAALVSHKHCCGDAGRACCALEPHARPYSTHYVLWCSLSLLVSEHAFKQLWLIHLRCCQDPYALSSFKQGRQLTLCYRLSSWPTWQPQHGHKH